MDLRYIQREESSPALLEVDLEKNKKKIQAPQHFEFVALVVLHSLLSLMGIVLCLHALAEPLGLQANIRSLVIASVERNRTLDLMEARRIAGSHGAVGCC
ncbi:hypothetical protein ACLOJK_039087 [Asimina triloba]